MKKCNVILVLSRFTLQELFHQRITYILGFFGLVFLLCMSCMGYFRPEEQMKFLQDIGITFFSVFAFVMILFYVPTIVCAGHDRSREVVFLTKPITRFEYLAGRMLAIVIVIIASLLCMGLAFMALLYVRFHAVNVVMGTVLYLLLLKYLLFLSIVIFLACWCDRLMVFFAGFMLFFLSNGIVFFDTIAAQLQQPYYRCVVWGLKLLLPRFDLFNMIDVLVLGESIPLIYVGKVTVYAVLYAGGMMALSNIIYSRRNF